MENKEYQKILDEIKDSFKNAVSDSEKKAKFWAEKIIELKLAQLTSANEEEKERKRISEQFAWAAIMNIVAENAEKVEKNGWKIVEKLFILLRNIILKG